MRAILLAWGDGDRGAVTLNLSDGRVFIPVFFEHTSAINVASKLASVRDRPIVHVEVTGGDLRTVRKNVAQFLYGTVQVTPGAQLIYETDTAFDEVIGYL